MTTAKICSFLFALAAFGAVASAQESAVYAPRTEARIVRIQPAMRHVGARLVVTRTFTSSAQEASMRTQLRQRLQRLPSVHFRHV